MSIKAPASTHGRAGYVSNIDQSTGLHLLSCWYKGFDNTGAQITHTVGARVNLGNRCQGRIVGTGGNRTIGFHQSAAITTPDTQAPPDPAEWQHHAIMFGNWTGGAATDIFNWHEGAKIKTNVTLAAGATTTFTVIDVINPQGLTTNVDEPIHAAQFGYFQPADEAEADTLVAELLTTPPADVTTVTATITDSFTSSQGGLDFFQTGLTVDAADNPSFSAGGGLGSPVVVIV